MPKCDFNEVALQLISPIFLDSSQLLPVEVFFYLTRTCRKRENEVFICFYYCFIPRFFLLVETIIEIREKSIF